MDLSDIGKSVMKSGDAAIYEKLGDKYTIETYYNDFDQGQIITIFTKDRSKSASRLLLTDDVMSFYEKSFSSAVGNLGPSITTLILNIIDICIKELEGENNG